MKDFAKNKGLTEGVIWKQLLLFALPLLGSSFIQQLYNTVDLLFAGNMIGKEATAAVGASSLLINCIVGFFTGLSVGTSVVVSQSVGADDPKRTDQTIHTAMGISLIFGILLMIIGILSARQVLVWMKTPSDLLPLAVSYVQIYFLSLLPLVIYNMNAGIIRAIGDSKTPMLIQLAGGITNVVMDYISIRFWNLGVEGIAWASMFSQGLSAILSVIYLMKGSGIYRLKWKKVRISKNIFSAILRIGIPAGLQSLVITLSNIFVQSKINGFGVDVIAAFSVYFKLELLIYLPIVAFGQAITTFTGQNIGAGKLDRVKKGVNICIAMGIGFVICIALLSNIFGSSLFWCFNREPEVISCGLRIIRISFPLYWLYAILEVLADAVRGAGKSLPPMLIIFASICVFRTILLSLFTQIWGSLESVVAVYPSAWVAASLCLVLYWRSERWIPLRQSEMWK